jgi:hypothetical protein
VDSTGATGAGAGAGATGAEAGSTDFLTTRGISFIYLNEIKILRLNVFIFQKIKVFYMLNIWRTKIKI